MKPFKSEIIESKGILHNLFMMLIVLVFSNNSIGQSLSNQETLLIGNWRIMYSDTLLQSKKTAEDCETKPCQLFSYLKNKSFVRTYLDTRETGNWQIKNGALIEFTRVVETSIPKNQKLVDLTYKIIKLTNTTLILEIPGSVKNHYVFFGKIK